jgi:hypothetical protein
VRPQTRYWINSSAEPCYLTPRTQIRNHFLVLILSQEYFICCNDSFKKLPQSDGLPLFYLTNRYKG